METFEDNEAHTLADEPRSAAKKNKKRRIAILGAGPAGLSAAYGLSKTQSLRDEYEVVVYQLGWRAGGKITSGREGEEERVIVNGTHYLFGCYDNAFAMARDAYDSLTDSRETQYGRFDEAFSAINLLVFKQKFKGQWHDWMFEVPQNDRIPGSSPADLSPWVLLGIVVRWLEEAVAGWSYTQAVRPERGHPILSAVRELFADIRRPLRPLAELTLTELTGRVRELTNKHANQDTVPPHISRAMVRFLKSFRALVHRLVEPELTSDLAVLRRWILIDMGCTCLIGGLQDDIFAPGALATLDELDFREWLAHHGASPQTLDSPPVTGWYDAICAYELGEADMPSVSAGASLQCLTMAVMAYKGAFAYNASRELGESWVAPVYSLLKARGVKFRFFSKVHELVTKNGRIESLRMEQQAPLSNGDPYDYQPFETVANAPAWPNRPRYDQLHPATCPDPRDPGKTLTLEDVDLEDFYTPWRGEMYTLERRKDFDDVVYTLPVDCTPYVCADLLSENKAWRRLADNVCGVDTRSLWLYFDRDLKEMGWPFAKPILSSYAQPFATWEETSYLLQTESWPADHQPKTVSSLFGPLPGPKHAPGPADPGGYPGLQEQTAYASAIEWLDSRIAGLWPFATSPDNPRGVDWQMLVDPLNREGEARFAAQGLRANYGPIQRYTLALPGTLKHRLSADETGYENLFVAGDWTKNGMIVGTVEGAVISGLMAAQAISGQGEIARSGFSHSGLY